LAQLHARLASDEKGSDQTRKQVTQFEELLAQKATERSRVVGLYRRGRLTDAELDAQIKSLECPSLHNKRASANLSGKLSLPDNPIGTR